MAKTGRTNTANSLLAKIISRLRKGKHKQETFYLTLKDGRLTIGWLGETPDEEVSHSKRYLNIGERVSNANVQQSIEFDIKDFTDEDEE